MSKPKFQVLAMAMSLAFAGCATTHEEDGLAAGGDLHFWFPRQWDEATAVTMFAALPNAPDDSLDDGDAPALADLDLHPLNSDMPSAYDVRAGEPAPLARACENQGPSADQPFAHSHRKYAICESEFLKAHGGRLPGQA